MHLEEAKKLLEQCDRLEVTGDHLPQYKIRWYDHMILWTKKDRPLIQVADSRSGIDPVTKKRIYRVHIYKDKTSFEGVAALQLIPLGNKMK